MNRITDAETIETPPRISDGDLLRRFLAERDDRAFAELVARHGSMVYGVAMRRLGQSQDAEDAFQAVFLALATHAEKLVDGVTVGPWLYTVARQVGTKALRSRRRRRWVFWGSMPEPAIKPPVEVDVDLDAALATLNEQERSAVILCHLEGLSRSEAAKALGCPEGTLSTRLSRALEKLRRKLGKPPLAILAAATMVMLPESLPAAAVGLVRHLRDGTLDDWASPKILDLYRKAVPMRFLDRFGPAMTAVVAAGLILVGAAFGWRLVTAQQPNVAKQPPRATAQPAKKKNFAAVVEEMQSGTKQPASEQRAPVQLQVIASTAGPQPGTTAPRTTRHSVRFKMLEVLNGVAVEHLFDWPGMVPLLKQVAGGGNQTIDVKIEGRPDRLQVNQVVNNCKRAGFKFIHYAGPELFLGRPEDPSKDNVDVPFVQFSADLMKSKEYLPDWTNGWCVMNGVLKRENLSLLAITPEIAEMFAAIEGAKGPAYELFESMQSQDRLADNGRTASDFAAQIGERQKRDSAPRVSVKLWSHTDNLGGIEASLAGITVGLTQQFKHGYASTTTNDVRAFAPMIARAAAVSRERVDVLPGEGGDRWSALGSARINPLHLNVVLNACKRAGVGEVHYFGQDIFTGAETEYIAPATAGGQNSPFVRMVLVMNELEGDLPEESAGWTGFRFYQMIGVTKKGNETNLRARIQKELKEQAMKQTPAGGETEAEEIARLAKLPLDEFEKELAKKPALLRNRWRKSVEELKSKTPAK